MADSYHHGNLRQALIEAGIKIINESGEENLSLRKVAALCNVSHAAPYAHFKDKDELLEAIKSSVTDRFIALLGNMTVRTRYKDLVAADADIATVGFRIFSSPDDLKIYSYEDYGIEVFDKETLKKYLA